MKELNSNNYKELLPYILDANYPDYNSNIYTMMMWEEGWQMYYETYEHFAYVGFYLDDEYLHYFLPYCKKEYLKEAIDYLYNKCIKDNIPCRIHSFNDEMKDFINSYYEGQGYFMNYLDGRDYIYDRKHLETLKGKKMQKRRNHFNAFLKEYENRYEIKPLSKNQLEDIIDCLVAWQEKKEKHDSINEEEHGILFLINHFDEFEIDGICIYIDGKLEAFNICSKLTNDMVQVHIEKANKNIRGLYVAVLKFYLETLDDSILYVNLEDDMGLPSLRKAKQDMKPILIQNKYSFTFDPVTISHPKNEDIYELKELWYSRFTDEDKNTTNFYFDEIYKQSNAYIIRNSKEIMAMAFFNPWNMIIHDENKTVYFLEGVCTKEEYEHCGVMKTLVNYMLNLYKDEEIALQAYNWDLYKPFGFEVTHYLKYTKIDSSYDYTLGDFTLCKDVNILYYLYQSFIENKDGVRNRDLAYYQYFYLPYASLCDEDIFLYKENDQILGYIKMNEDDDIIYVSEIIYSDIQSLEHILGLLNTFEKEVIVVHDMDIEIKGESEIKNALMMLHTRNIYHAYVNEIL